MSGIEGIYLNMIKVFMLLYADDIEIFANSAEELQQGLDLLSDYCKRCKLKINVSKTNEIVNKFKYLGILFTSGGSFAEAQNTLSVQAQNAIF